MKAKASPADTPHTLARIGKVKAKRAHQHRHHEVQQRVPGSIQNLHTTPQTTTPSQEHRGTKKAGTQTNTPRIPARNGKGKAKPKHHLTSHEPQP